MQRPGYERFALIANPFHDLASESLEEIELFHVHQEADEAIEAIKQEVLEKARKAFVFVVGQLGSGKTQRLRMTASQAEHVGAYSQYLNLGEAPPDPIAAIAQGLVEAVAQRKVAKGFSPPKWSKELQGLAKGKGSNPETAGRTLAEALAALAPSYLLLNDLDALPRDTETAVLHTLLALVSHLQPGVMVLIACQEPHFATLNARAGPLVSRVNRVLQLRGLTDEEAELVLAKRMAGKRLIEDLDPVYPFTRPAVAELNKAAGRSPRRLLQFADLVLDHAVKERAFHVGPDLVQAALARAPALVEPRPLTPTAVPNQPLAFVPAPASRPLHPARPRRASAVPALPAPSPTPPVLPSPSVPPPAPDAAEAPSPAPAHGTKAPDAGEGHGSEHAPGNGALRPRPDPLARGLFGRRAKR
jgi:energy-coupling factor transporter ATP-binding protein EcfA2